MNNKTRRQTFFLIIVVVFLVIIGLRVFLMIFGTTGGGQGLKSPDGLYKAMAMSFNKRCFWGNRKLIYELSVRDKEGQIVRWIRIEALDNKPYFPMRESDKIIKWSSDSSEVVFSFQGTEYKMKVKE